MLISKKTFVIKIMCKISFKFGTSGGQIPVGQTFGV